ncbi:hypothetical protein [Kitasatospora indigofera]|uniref:hypothetical protein n=1 Tax=Kitasatospora indigofera TaxID=67307 RepID=UPI003673C807
MTQSDDSEAQFEEELARLHVRKQYAEPERRMIVLGLVLAAAGIVLLVTSLVGSRQVVTVQQQLDNLALAPLGLGLTAVGATLWLRNSLTRYLRFWLVRLIYEERVNTDRLAAAKAPTKEGE